MLLKNIALLSSYWIFYFLLHSYLASHSVKNTICQRLPHLARFYRIFYNLLAVFLLIPPLYFIYFTPSPQIWNWEGFLKILLDLMAFSSLIGFVWSLKFYNNMDYLGLSQLKQKNTQLVNQFTLSPLHRYVRHPWYFFALMIIWTRDMNLYFLVSAILMTVYFIIGSKLEENKLVAEFGEVYCQYQLAVPGLIPNPKKYLSKSEADSLLKSNW